jgi:16S rRNA (guanine966-N2)-methyltransferase
MSALQPALPGARVLDLYAGSGALGLEALSRGAAHATFVERAGGALRTLRANLTTLGAQEQATVVRANALSYVAKLPALAFDLVLADPPYGSGDASALARIFGKAPFGRWLWIEHRRAEALPALPGSVTRRYGDTALTSIPADE